MLLAPTLSLNIGLVPIEGFEQYLRSIEKEMGE